jgi:hypothetical protein
MIQKVIELQCKVLSSMAFAQEGKFDQKELNCYTEVLGTCNLDDSEIQNLMKYTKKPPPYKKLLNELSKVPFHIAFSILKNSYIIARISKGVQKEQERILKDFAQAIKIPSNMSKELDQIFRSSFKVYQLEEKIFQNKSMNSRGGK